MTKFIDDITEYDYGDIMTLPEFLSSCKYGAFIDYDGFGHAACNGKVNSDLDIRPSKLNEIPEGTTHIVWFNR
ncbi:MAG: hypothetical protein DRQ89_12495 [Epsilonproteobacteria bacterium]|nr:MAG: hypothetical protein DRQ89_12495 [Campylobacterota bacterium]